MFEVDRSSIRVSQIKMCKSLSVFHSVSCSCYLNKYRLGQHYFKTTALCDPASSRPLRRVYLQWPKLKVGISSICVTHIKMCNMYNTCISYTITKNVTTCKVRCCCGEFIVLVSNPDQETCRHTPRSSYFLGCGKTMQDFSGSFGNFCI